MGKSQLNKLLTDCRLWYSRALCDCHVMRFRFPDLATHGAFQVNTGVIFFSERVISMYTCKCSRFISVPLS